MPPCRHGHRSNGDDTEIECVGMLLGRTKNGANVTRQWTTTGLCPEEAVCKVVEN